jgi:hypothetical protein
MRWLLVFLLAFLLFNGLSAWLRKIGLGRLPGDISIQRPGFSFYFPLTSGLLVSAGLSLVLWLLRR